MSPGCLWLKCTQMILPDNSANIDVPLTQVTHSSHQWRSKDYYHPRTKYEGGNVFSLSTRGRRGYPMASGPGSLPGLWSQVLSGRRGYPSLWSQILSGGGGTYPGPGLGEWVPYPSPAWGRERGYPRTGHPSHVPTPPPPGRTRTGVTPLGKTRTGATHSDSTHHGQDTAWAVCLYGSRRRTFLFLGGLSLHLNHLIAELVSAPYWNLGHFPLEFFCQIWSQDSLRHLLWHLIVTFEICQLLATPGPFEYFGQNWVSSENQSFLDEGATGLQCDLGF